MKIITVTLNPSLDRTLLVHHLALGYENQAIEGANLYASGRGMNIAMAARTLGAEVEAIVFLGTGPNSRAYEALLFEHSFPTRIVRYDGHIRGNIYIKDTGTGQETVIREDRVEIQPELFTRVENMLNERIEPDDFVVFAGRLPRGARDDTYLGLANAAKAAGARVVLDTEGDSLHRGLEAQPTLVALNQLRAERYYNFPVRVEKEAVYCAHKLCEAGAKRALIMLNNDKGAVLASEGKTYRVDFPDDIQIGTHSGVYEALLAGYLVGRVKEHSLDIALELGGAAAVYTATQTGSEFGTLKEVKEHLWEVNTDSVE